MATAEHSTPASDSDSEGTTTTTRAITVNRPLEELYAFWRDVGNLPKFMENIQSIEVLDERRSRWTVAAPGGTEVTWTSVIVEDEPDRLIAWRSEEGADIDNAGRIEFLAAPGGRGTQIRAEISYDPPSGAIGKLVAKLFQREPAIQTRRELRRFKQLMETGEISTAEPPDAAPRD
ncbi:SRPBCC family protein [Microbaculum marinum]|uniref:SRPBCC family protein n=1 Tax=Microbaculum marinum TaxID=1764581 RepID=A0AAW9RAS7_9HYPH